MEAAGGNRCPGGAIQKDPWGFCSSGLWPNRRNPAGQAGCGVQGYLLLHGPQLIAQVDVHLQKLLDFRLRSHQGVFHLQVFLGSDGAVRQVGVQALGKDPPLLLRGGARFLSQPPV